jgi:hypothetical protein
VTPDQSRQLAAGQRVAWLGHEQDCGSVIERDWTGVRIRWDTGKDSFHHHNDMRNIELVRLRR